MYINLFLTFQYFHNIEELEWGVELALQYGKPVAATLCMGPTGDGAGVLPGECAVRAARAGAHIVGVNCLFGPFVTLETLKLMKAGLDEAGLSPYLMAQPLAYRTPDVGRFGWVTLPEFPYGRPTYISAAPKYYLLACGSDGAAADNALGGGQVRPGGLPARGAGDRRLLRVRALPHPGHGGGASGRARGPAGGLG